MPSEWNQKHKCIKPELLNDNTYAFSFSPNPPNCNEHTERLVATIKTVTRLFKRLTYCRIKAAIESSASGRFHYHGTIKILNIPQFILHDMPLLQADATYEIDTIQDKSIWENYVYKQRHIWEDFIEKKDLPQAYRYIVTTGTQ